MGERRRGRCREGGCYERRVEERKRGKVSEEMWDGGREGRCDRRRVREIKWEDMTRRRKEESGNREREEWE